MSGNEGVGYPVKEDIVIRSIRKIKRFFGIAKNNRLIVSEEMYEEYKKRRTKFEKTLVQYIALAVIIFIAFVGLSLLSGTLSLGTFIISIFIGAFLVLFSLTSYVPAIEETPQPPPSLSEQPSLEKKTSKQAILATKSKSKKIKKKKR